MGIQRRTTRTTSSRSPSPTPSPPLEGVAPSLTVRTGKRGKERKGGKVVVVVNVDWNLRISRILCGLILIQTLAYWWEISIAVRTLWRCTVYPDNRIKASTLHAYDGKNSNYPFVEKWNRYSKRRKASSESSNDRSGGGDERSGGSDEQSFYSTHPLLSSSSPYDGPARVFPVYPHRFPCAKYDGVRKGPTSEGFLYMKEMKTASTTLAGITLRISRNVARRQFHRDPDEDPCLARYFHMRARKFRDRNRTQSFLWSMLRDPNERMLSKFFHFGVTRQHMDPTVEAMDAYFHEYKNWIYDQAYYLKSLAARDPIHPRDPEYYVNETRELLNDYDFLGITERLHESLVVLQLLLRLETGDLLYIHSKGSDTFEFFPHTQSCVYMIPRFTTPKFEEYMVSEKWQRYTEADNLLYRAVNKSLDLTIDALGRDVVAHHVRKLDFAQTLVHSRCDNNVVSLCDEDGFDRRSISNCLFQDSGCGYDCLDQVAEELRTMKAFQKLV